MNRKKLAATVEKMLNHAARHIGALVGVVLWWAQ